MCRQVSYDWHVGFANLVMEPVRQAYSPPSVVAVWDMCALPHYTLVTGTLNVERGCKELNSDKQYCIRNLSTMWSYDWYDFQNSVSLFLSSPKGRG